MVVLLTIGGTLLFISCGGSKKSEDIPVPETLMTQRAEDLIIIESKQGLKKNRFQTPLVEGYDYAKEPYKEFRKGIKIETYADSTERIESTLVSDYAIFFEKRELWEAKGNVVVTNAEGDVLETQQLFWNQRTAKIYSNVDSKITRGDDIMVGVGFESDEAFTDWEFRKPRGKGAVEVDLNDSDDTSTASSTPAAKEPVPPTAGGAGSTNTPPAPQQPSAPKSSDTGIVSGSESAPADPKVIAQERLERQKRMESSRPSRVESTDSVKVPSVLKLQ